MKEGLLPSEWKHLVGDLVESWSIGLLSGSAPWRMICALTTAGLINFIPLDILNARLDRFPTIKKLYQRLPGSIARRIWAERAAVPISSRYVQALIELVSSLKNAGWDILLPLRVDAATPKPLNSSCTLPWEEDEGWILSDSWQTWLGTVEYFPVKELEIPTRSSVRALMDEGKGPPMLREGCMVCRGSDWEYNDDDGKAAFESERAVYKGKSGTNNKVLPPDQDLNVNPLMNDKLSDSLINKKRSNIEPPVLPIGIVLSIEPWEGTPGMGRRVRWQRTGKEGFYRFGGGGGRFDICHVEVNKKKTKIRKKHPYPESMEQTMARHGFGCNKKFNVLLRVRNEGKKVMIVPNDVDIVHDGILEWPDMGAGIHVKCILHSDGAMTIEEKSLLYGPKHSGWEVRFGQPDFVPGSTIVLSPTASENSISDRGENEGSLSLVEQLLGSSSHRVKFLKRKKDGSKLRIASEMRILRRKNICKGEIHISGSLPQALTFDKDYHAHNISVSQNGRMATCQSSNGRCIAFGSIGFSKGVHYWEVKLEQADIGSVFIGVAEKPTAISIDTPKLSRWIGWGFVNFRATYTSGIERVYGSHTSNGDIIGVLLDCDAGRISYFYDGVKYGEHILNDLGVAFSNLSPFGFNADGCGGGGANQGAPSGLDGGTRSSRYPANGAVRTRTLWPVIGFKNRENRVIFTGKWLSNYGTSCVKTLNNVMKVDEAFRYYQKQDSAIPRWMEEEGFCEYNKWSRSTSLVSSTRGCSPIPLCTSNLDVVLDTRPYSCAVACAMLGMQQVLLSGDKVEVKRCQGRVLESPEIAEVLGVMNDRIFYRLISQKSDGGSLTEGGGRSWFWDESEVVDNSIVLTDMHICRDIENTLPLLDRYKCRGYDLCIIYEKGALLRSDLEIDSSKSIGTIICGTIIPNRDILDCRMNSSGVLRYQVIYNAIVGWISSRIRGGTEQMIVKRVSNSITNIDASSIEVDVELKTYHQNIPLPEDAANIWFEKFSKMFKDETSFTKLTFEKYKFALVEGVFPNMTESESDSFIVHLIDSMNAVSPQMEFNDVKIGLKAALESPLEATPELSDKQRVIQQAILCSFQKITTSPSIDSLLARICMLQAINRRTKQALVWLPLKTTQEGSSLFGGNAGYGTSIDRIGRDILLDRHKVRP